MMKYLFSSLFLLFVCFALTAPVPAQTKAWEKIASDAFGIYYLQPKKCTTERGIVACWVRYRVLDMEGRHKSYDDEDPRTKEIQFAWEVDCKSRTFRVTDYIYYDGDGDLLKSLPDREAPMMKMPPESLGEAVGESICDMTSRSR